MTEPDPGPALVRAFVAIDVNDVVREALVDCRRRLARAGGHVAWVPDANLHLSLLFLGDVPARLIPPLGAALDEAAAAVPPFEFEVAGAGTFGGPRSPRVIWAGVEAPAALAALHARAKAAAQSLELRTEDRPFRAHVTLGRVRSGRNREALAAALARERDLRAGRTAAEGIVLYRSILEPAGARYTVLHGAPLAADRNVLVPPPGL